MHKSHVGMVILQGSFCLYSQNYRAHHIGNRSFLEEGREPLEGLM